jgi:hypothetical protein
MNMISPVPNGEHLEEGELSAGGSVEGDRADDSEDDDDDEEDSDWVGSGEDAPTPPRKERRAKANRDPGAAPSKTVASSTRNPKRGRTATPDSTEKVPKVPKPGVPKTRKALPRMKIEVPVASV